MHHLYNIFKVMSHSETNISHGNPLGTFVEDLKYTIYTKVSFGNPLGTFVEDLTSFAPKFPMRILWKPLQRIPHTSFVARLKAFGRFFKISACFEMGRPRILQISPKHYSVPRIIAIKFHKDWLSRKKNYCTEIIHSYSRCPQNLYGSLIKISVTKKISTKTLEIIFKIINILYNIFSNTIQHEGVHMSILVLHMVNKSFN